jgi:hypothetical protein
VKLFSQADKNLKNSKYEKTESVLLDWFRHEQALNIPIQGQMLRLKAEETIKTKY